MRWSRLPNPAHLIHQSVETTATIVVWFVLGLAITATGGLLAARGASNRRVYLGMLITAAGVVVLAAGVWFHRSMAS